MFYKVLREKRHSKNVFLFNWLETFRSNSHSFRFRRFAGAMIAFLAVAVLAGTCSAQGLEISGGWAHLSSDFGLDGFNVGASWWFSHRVSIAADYDNVYDTSRIGQFELTSVGVIVAKNHLQEIMFGPRIFFPPHEIHKHSFDPFAEAQFGESHLNTTVQQLGTSVSASGTAFAWMLGGGADYSFTPHWSGRAKLDYLRTHFADEGQNRLRFALEVIYTFGEKP